jgi:N-acetylmuramoyl-L-alanine amidase
VKWLSVIVTPGWAMLFALSGLGAAPYPAAAAALVETARYSVDQSRTRVVLEVSARCTYQVTTLEGPDRLVINIPDARSGAALKPISMSSGAAHRLRVNRLSWGLQVVLDLRGPTRWEDFTLPRSGEQKDRIVVDLFEPVRAAATTGRSAHREETFVVAIDAGHGGSDPGTTGRFGLVEKTLALDIAKRVAERIGGVPGFKTVMTRNRDVYLTLPDRTAIAARQGADAFVSIHLNSARNRSARGAEVFFLSPSGARVTADRVLSDPRRAAGEMGLRGEDNPDILYMLVDVNQQAIMMRSERLAESILESLGRSDLPPSRLVKQKSFSVLRTIEMPSVLVEAGFVSNVNDATVIRTTSGRERIAEAIARGIVSYFKSNPPPRAEGEKTVVHKVQRGESLWGISQLYNTTVASLRAANHLKDSAVIHVGQELVVTNR